jgi:hypothetical protein
MTAQPATPVDARPAIITHDELGRLFGAVVLMTEQLEQYRSEPFSFDPDTYNVVALVESLVTRRQTGPDAWSVHVAPFAVQPPLPGMPSAPITTGGGSR